MFKETAGGQGSPPLRFWAVCILALLVAACGGTPIQAQLVAPPAPADLTGFERAEGPVPLNFPADHGPHEGYQTEWWYYTGSLEGEEGERFGYQLTFFRRSLAAPGDAGSRPSDWSSEQVYMAHFALSDIGQNKFYAFERFSRGAAGLAGAEAAPFEVWLEDWLVELISSPDCETGSEPCRYRMHAAVDGLVLDLELVDRMGPVLQGQAGFSPKGSETGQASYYYSLPRLESSGSIQIDGRKNSVNGWSWMDHEYSTSALSAEQVGWDWFSLHVEGGGELMLFQIRRADGSIDPFSSGAFIAPDGTRTDLSRDDFSIEVTQTWRSPDSEAEYPAGWTIRIPKLDIILKVRPLIAAQELRLSYTYWEGAVVLEGSSGAQPLNGYGYVELTGYAGSMGGEF